MINRVVRMTFHPEKVKEFLSLFEENKDKIRHFYGCSYLELWNDINSPNCFYTYSHWESETCLNNYRDSELFSKVWGKTKVLFSAKPEAWSTMVVVKVE